MANQPYAAPLQRLTRVEREPLEADPHGGRRGGRPARRQQPGPGRPQERAPPHAGASARTAASATWARTARMALFSRVGWTRLVSRIT